MKIIIEYEYLFKRNENHKRKSNENNENHHKHENYMKRKIIENPMGKNYNHNKI